MRIPMAALRRALREMAGAGGVPHIERGMLTGMLPGAALGGIGGAAMDMANDDGDPETGGAGMGMGLIGGALGGMALGAGAGGLAKLAHMSGAGAGGFSRGLREALAARAAERGWGRAVSRVADDVDDAARFHGAADEFGGGVDVPLVQNMRANPGQHAPYLRGDNPTGQMDELNAANRILRRLQQQRGMATHPDEIADIDEQIEELARMLGGGM